MLLSPYNIRQQVVEALSGKRVVFHHIPKCGGTSIGKALRRRYPLSSARLPVVPAYQAIKAQYPELSEANRNFMLDDFFSYRLLKMLFQDVRCVIGHVRFSDEAFQKFGERYHFVTTLREPLALMISQFNFQKRVRRADVWTIQDNLEQYLETDEARRIGAIFPYFFSGLPTTIDPRSSESVSRAKENLKKFAVIGFVDEMADFERRLSKALTVHLRIGHANKSSSERKDENGGLSPDVRRKLEKINEANTDVYNFARLEFGKLCQSSP